VKTPGLVAKVSPDRDKRSKDSQSIGHSLLAVGAWKDDLKKESSNTERHGGPRNQIRQEERKGTSASEEVRENGIGFRVLHRG